LRTAPIQGSTFTRFIDDELRVRGCLRALASDRKFRSSKIQSSKQKSMVLRKIFNVDLKKKIC
jgi:hypothetical protein